MKQQIPPTAVLQVIDHEKFRDDHEEIEILLDIFWALGMDTKGDKEQRKILISIIKPITDLENSPFTVPVRYYQRNL